MGHDMGKRRRNRAGQVIYASALISGVGALTAHAEVQQAAAAALPAPPFSSGNVASRIGRPLLTCAGPAHQPRVRVGPWPWAGHDCMNALGTSGALESDRPRQFVGDHMGQQPD
jgi:hypothetical protein